MSSDGRDPSLLELEALVRELLASGICVGMQSSRHGITLWIADVLGRSRKDHTIEIDDRSGNWPSVTAAQWFHDTALELFPGSAYASRHLVTRIKPAAATRRPGF
jgi:hypothetical protein